MAMAFPPDELPASLNATNAIQVGQYVINSKNVLGKGAFGTVTTATDARNQVVAVKRLDGTDKRKLERLTKDLDKLLDLSHENLVEMFSVQQEDTTIWMFMHFCPHGDLGKFFTAQEVTQDQTLDIMTQVAMGILYLHSRNVIHRDVKPSNILVSSLDPMVMKITDFDFCKFLEDGYDTSLLTTNVGTPAFKAPEFFQRTEAGQLRYHRSVDVYAAGLTFLAMLQRNRNLVPQIETPLEDSELWLPIGTIIAERIKYGKQPLEIVKVDSKQPLDNDLHTATESSESQKSVPDSGTVPEVRRLVREMTRVSPEERLSAPEVVLRLRALRSQSPLPEAVSSERKIPEVKLETVFTWEHGLYLSTTFTSGSYVIGRGQMTSSYTSDPSIDQYIRVLDQKTRKVICEMTSECKHNFCPLLTLPARPDHVMEACKECEEIRGYHVNSKESDVIVEECSVERFCVGPEGSMLICTAAGEVQQLRWREEELQPEVVHSIDVDMREPNGLCYVDQLDAVVMTSQSPAHDRGVTLKNGFFLWKFTRKVEKLKLDCWGVTADNHGRVYVADGKNKRLVVMDVRRGRLLQVLNDRDSVQVYATDTVLWNDTQPQLSVNDMWSVGGDKVHLYTVTGE